MWRRWGCRMRMAPIIPVWCGPYSVWKMNHWTSWAIPVTFLNRYGPHHTGMLGAIPAQTEGFGECLQTVWWGPYQYSPHHTAPVWPSHFIFQADTGMAHAIPVCWGPYIVEPVWPPRPPNWYGPCHTGMLGAISVCWGPYRFYCWTSMAPTMHTSMLGAISVWWGPYRHSWFILQTGWKIKWLGHTGMMGAYHLHHWTGMAPVMAQMVHLPDWPFKYFVCFRHGTIWQELVLFTTLAWLEWASTSATTWAMQVSYSILMPYLRDSSKAWLIGRFLIR